MKKEVINGIKRDMVVVFQIEFHNRRREEGF
jgi:hypothetical protein